MGDINPEFYPTDWRPDAPGSIRLRERYPDLYQRGFEFYKSYKKGGSKTAEADAQRLKHRSDEESEIIVQIVDFFWTMDGRFVPGAKAIFVKAVDHLNRS